MRDMSVSSSAHNGRAMIIFFSSSSFFWKHYQNARQPIAVNVAQNTRDRHVLIS